MKKMLGIFLMSLVLLSAPVFAETIYVDGEAKEVETIIVNDRKLVPLRQLGTMLGMETGYQNGIITVTFDNEDPVKSPVVHQKITLDTKEKRMQKYRIEFYVNGGNTIVGFPIAGCNTYTTGQEVELSIIDGTSYVPLRAIAEPIYMIQIKENIIYLEKNSKDSYGSIWSGTELIDASGGIEDISKMPVVFE